MTVIVPGNIQRELIETRPAIYNGGKARNNHLYLLNYEENTLPLFIIPGIGGKTDRFRMFGKILRHVCTVYGLEMLGTQRDETPLTSLEEIASLNIEWIRQVQPCGPYSFVAQSFGGYIAMKWPGNWKHRGKASVL